MHHLTLENVLFQPSPAFAANLYSADWVWLIPDKPSGISIFFCPDSSSAPQYITDYEKGLALLEKIEKSDVTKLIKQSITLPPSVINAVFMLQNLKAVIDLCFREESQLAICILSWIGHIMKHRQIYFGCQ